MNFDPAEVYQSTLEHLFKLAQEPGFKAYAWEQAKRYDQDPSGLWVGIAGDLVKKMKELDKG